MAEPCSETPAAPRGSDARFRCSHYDHGYAAGFDEGWRTAADPDLGHRIVPRSVAEALAEALEAITRDDCMISRGETGSWIDTEAPARIAENALDGYRSAYPQETP